VQGIGYQVSLGSLVTTSISLSDTPCCLSYFIPLLDLSFHTFATNLSTLSLLPKRSIHNVHSSSIAGSSCSYRCCSSCLGHPYHYILTYPRHHILAYRRVVQWHGHPGFANACSNVDWTLDGKHDNELHRRHPRVQNHLPWLMGTRGTFPRGRIRESLLQTIPK
jgi:hypothetical protein